MYTMCRKFKFERGVNRIFEVGSILEHKKSLKMPKEQTKVINLRKTVV